MSLKLISYTEDTNKEGKTATSTFLCSYYEYFNSKSLPRVGWTLPWNYDLVCTQVSMSPAGTAFDTDYIKGLPLSVLVNVTINYSTMGRPERAMRPNQSGSWQIYTTSTMQSATVNEYLDLNSPEERKIWKDEYEDAIGKTIEEVPPLEMNYIATQLNVVAFADFAKYSMCNDVLATVNSISFIGWLVDTWKEGLANLDYRTWIPYTDLGNFIDTAGHWLCSSAQISQETTNVFRYNFSFDYSEDGHNSPYGVVMTNQFPEYDFRYLFEGMSETNPEISGQFY